MNSRVWRWMKQIRLSAGGVLTALVMLMALVVPARAAIEDPEPLQKDELFVGTDEFAKNAKNVTEVNLDKRMLAMMGRFLASDADKGDKEDINVARKMEFVYVRSYEYEKAGQYRAAALDAFRQRLEGGQWSHVVKERSPKEQNDVWVRSGEDGSFSELVVISAEESELNFVHLKGHMSVEDLERAGTRYGVPQGMDTKGKKGPK